MSTISSSTTSTTAYKVTADTTGTLVLQTGATPTTAVTVGTDQSVTLAGTLAVQSQNISPYTGFKNRIINGAMMIDQRNAGASVACAAASYNYAVDRFPIYTQLASKFTAQQSSVAPAGFSNSLLITSAAATTPGSGDEYCLYHKIEGYNVADMNFGSANAKTFTLSFWVRSSLTGTFSGCVAALGGARSLTFTYTISAANTWEQKTITIAGDQTGTWNIGNNVGLYIVWDMGTGSGQTTSTLNTWQTNFYPRASGAQAVSGTNGATFYITGVQLEKGSTATSFDYRPYGTELQLCQRYYEKWTIPAGGGGYVGGGVGMAWGAGQARIQIQYQVTKRANPSCTATGTITWNDSANAFTQTGFNFDSPLLTSTLLYGVISPTTATGGKAMQAYIDPANSFSIAFSSEL